jgi:hypothetical protein
VFQVYYNDAITLSVEPPAPDATGNPGRNLGEQHRFLIRRALQRFADELVSVEPLIVETGLREHYLHDQVYACTSHDRPSIENETVLEDVYPPPPPEDWDETVFGRWLTPAPGHVHGRLYPIVAMISHLGRERVLEWNFSHTEQPDIALHTWYFASYGICGTPTFWLGTGAPPPGRVSYEAAVMQAIAQQLGFRAHRNGVFVERAYRTTLARGSAMQVNFQVNAATGQAYSEATPDTVEAWKHAGEAVQLVSPRLLEVAAEQGVLARLGTVGVPLAADPPRFLHWTAGYAVWGFGIAQPRFHRFSASVAPADVMVDVVEVNPDWGIELTLAVLEDLGYQRYQAPPPIPPCEEREDCLIATGFE